MLAGRIFKYITNLSEIIRNFKDIFQRMCQDQLSLAGRLKYDNENVVEPLLAWLTSLECGHLQQQTKYGCHKRQSTSWVVLRNCTVQSHPFWALDCDMQENSLQKAFKQKSDYSFFQHVGPCCWYYWFLQQVAKHSITLGLFQMGLKSPVKYLAIVI